MSIKNTKDLKALNINNVPTITDLEKRLQEMGFDLGTRKDPYCFDDEKLSIFTAESKR